MMQPPDHRSALTASSAFRCFVCGEVWPCPTERLRAAMGEVGRLKASLGNMLDWANDANDWRDECCSDETKGHRHRKCAEWIEDRDEARMLLEARTAPGTGATVGPSALTADGPVERSERRPK